jgi:hypothetical protein
MKEKLLKKLRSSDAFMKEEEEAEIIKKFTEPIVVSPPHWEMCELPLELEWKFEKFGKGNEDEIPDDYGGVYTFVVQPGIANHPLCAYLFYVGKAEKQSFQERYGQYLATKKSKKTKWRHIRKMLNYWDGYLWFCYARIDNESLITKIEQILQDAYIPPYNEEFRGEAGPAIRVLR